MTRTVHSLQSSVIAIQQTYAPSDDNPVSCCSHYLLPPQPWLAWSINPFSIPIASSSLCPPGRPVMINDRELGATEAVRLEKDKLQIADMDYVVRTYLDYLYRVDQRSRAKDIEAALRLMVPGQAKKFAQYLTEQKVLQTQREQQWNAAWKVE